MSIRIPNTASRITSGMFPNDFHRSRVGVETSGSLIRLENEKTNDAEEKDTGDNDESGRFASREEVGVTSWVLREGRHG